MSKTTPPDSPTVAKRQGSQKILSLEELTSQFMEEQDQTAGMEDLEIIDTSSEDSSAQLWGEFLQTRTGVLRDKTGKNGIFPWTPHNSCLVKAVVNLRQFFGLACFLPPCCYSHCNFGVSYNIGPIFRF